MRIRNYSERTIKTYLYSVEQVARHYNQPPGKVTISQFKAGIKKNISPHMLVPAGYFGTLAAANSNTKKDKTRIHI